MNSKLKPRHPASLLLRLGLAFVFLYAAITSLIHPLEWIGYLPSFLVQRVDPTIALRLIALSEIGLAVWLLSGKYVKYAAALSAAMLAGIIVSNGSQFIITFRDVGLFFTALALFFLED